MPEGWEWARIKTTCVINPRNSIDDNTEKELSEKSARLREVDRLIAEAEKNEQQDEQNVDS